MPYAHGVRSEFGILGAKENCCGESIRKIDNEDDVIQVKDITEIIKAAFVLTQALAFPAIE